MMKTENPLGSCLQDSRILHRIFEFLGRDRTGNITAQFITSNTELRPVFIDKLFDLIDEGKGISRSEWDSKSLIAHLSINYVNFDFPAEAYLNPGRTLGLISLVVGAIKTWLNSFAIQPLHTGSFTGHELIWKIDHPSKAFKQLIQLGENPELFAQNPSPSEGIESVPVPVVKASNGLGLVIEYLAQEFRCQAAPLSPIAIDFAPIEVGPNARGREMVSIDVTEYGKPLAQRTMRIPFTCFQEPVQEDGCFHQTPPPLSSPAFHIPLANLSIQQIIATSQNQKSILDWAEKASSKIPDCSPGMSRIIDHYKASSLRQFHLWYYREPYHQASVYKGLATSSLPPCANFLLNQPRSLLTKPWGFRLLTRVLIALGWHPRHIAGVILTRLNPEISPKIAISKYEAASQVDFYTRLFSGSFLTKKDDLVDFNCCSSKEEKMCSITDCRDNLVRFQQSALTRRDHDLVGQKPFNSLCKMKRIYV